MKPWKTAITRSKLPAPTQFLLDNGKLKGDILDYGCGRCHDINNQYFVADGYDPYFKDMKFDKQYDTIICNYVLNVVNEEEREKILNDLYKLLKPGGTAYVTVRRDMKENYTTKETEQFLVYLPFNTVNKTSGYEMYEVWFVKD